LLLDILDRPHGGGAHSAYATLLPNWKVLVIGGYNALGSTQFSATYDPAAGTWTLMNTRLANERGQHAVALLPGGNTLMVTGGSIDCRALCQQSFSRSTTAAPPRR